MAGGGDQTRGDEQRGAPGWASHFIASEACGHWGSKQSSPPSDMHLKRSPGRRWSEHQARLKAGSRRPLTISQAWGEAVGLQPGQRARSGRKWPGPRWAVEGAPAELPGGWIWAQGAVESQGWPQALPQQCSGFWQLSWEVVGETLSPIMNEKLRANCPVLSAAGGEGGTYVLWGV